MSDAPKTSNLVRKAEKKRRLHLQKHGDVENAVYLELVENVKIAIKEEGKRDALTKARAEKSQHKAELSRITSDDILEEYHQENALTNAANAVAKAAAKVAADAEKAAEDAAARKSARNTKKNKKKKEKQKRKKAVAARMKHLDMISARIEILEAQKSHPNVSIPLSAEIAMLDFKKLVMI